jgi:hypothetical protein
MTKEAALLLFNSVHVAVSAKAIRNLPTKNRENAPQPRGAFLTAENLGCINRQAAHGLSEMPNASKKLAQPIARRPSTICLLDGRTPIKLPIPPNPVHRIQQFLKTELSKEKPRSALRVRTES